MTLLLSASISVLTLLRNQIQYAAIGLGTAAFSGVALFIACTSYRSARMNNLGIYNEAQILVGTYSSGVFGAFIVGAVIWRSFDPAFILGAESETREEAELPFIAIPARKLSSNTARCESSRQTLDYSGDTAVLPSQLGSSYSTNDHPSPTSPALEALHLAPPLTTLSPSSRTSPTVTRSQYGAWRGGDLQRPT